MFSCNQDYLKDFDEYIGRVVSKYGFSSQSAEREIISLAYQGNTVALKTYGDLLFYKKIYRKNPYREAFKLYLQAAGIDSDTGINDAHAYPLAFWSVGYYLVNYRRESYLKKSERIDYIENMGMEDRLLDALELAYACINNMEAPGAVNLIGRILSEAAGDEEVFAYLKDRLNFCLANPELVKITKVSRIDSPEDCMNAAESYFMAAADMGYVYSCNSLASREADRILKLCDEYGHKYGDKADGEIPEHIDKYIHYLKTAADKYEPYAANKLGLFYLNGEIKGSGSGSEAKVTFREYADGTRAKEYFLKATVYPDASSAWAFFNLIKYFPKDYDNNIELMNEYMDSIKELNPAVYDIAIEL